MPGEDSLSIRRVLCMMITFLFTRLFKHISAYLPTDLLFVVDMMSVMLLHPRLVWAGWLGGKHKRLLSELAMITSSLFRVCSVGVIVVGPILPIVGHLLYSFRCAMMGAFIIAMCID